MADSSQLLTDLPPDVAQEYAAIQRRKAIADMIARQSLQPVQAQPQSGRFAVPINPLQAIAQAVSAKFARQGQEESDKALADLGTKYQAKSAEELQKYQQMRQGAPLAPDSSQLFTNPAEASPESTATTGGNPRAAVAQAMLNPYLKNSPLIQADLKQQEAENTLRIGKELASHEAALARRENDVNKPFSIGPDGQPVANTAVQQFELEKAKAGRMVTADVIRRGQDMTDARARELASPEYKAQVANEVAFTKGRQGDLVRSLNVAHDHLNTWQQAADALKNGDNQTFNRLAALVGKQFGTAPPTNLEAMARIVGPEVEKSIVASAGGVGERGDIIKSLGVELSPSQQFGTPESYRKLLLGQIQGLQRQYLAGGGTQENFDKKLSPEMLMRLETAKATNAGRTGSVLKFDAQGNLIK